RCMRPTPARPPGPAGARPRDPDPWRAPSTGVEQAMAKQCAVCRRSYPEELESCPHCAADAARRAAPGVGGGPADSVIDLGQLPPGGSGSDARPAGGEGGSQSSLVWASLVEDDLS